MIGKLLSNPLRAFDGLSPSNNTNTTTSSARSPRHSPLVRSTSTLACSSSQHSFHASPSLFDDAASIKSSSSSSAANKPPISVLDEADTLNLLYGSTTLSASSSKSSPYKDIHVTIISDVPFLDYAFFDSQTALADLASLNNSSSNNMMNRPPPPPTWQSADMPSFRDLQERVFGSSQIKYHGPTTKLHPFPTSAASSSSSSSSSRAGSQKWLVSRLFRLASAPNPNPDSNNINVSNSDPLANTLGNPPAAPALAHGADANVTAVTGEEDRRRRSEQVVADYTCAICVFVTAPANATATEADAAQPCITQHWDELNAALLQLQDTVAARLAAQLPLSYRHFQRDMVRSFHCFAADDVVKHAVDSFRHRFLDAVNVPRVLCGQKRWPALLNELQWAADHFSKSFLPLFLATFIKYNPQLIAGSTQAQSSPSSPSLTGFVGPDAAVRTVVVGDRITTRRLIFILSSLISGPALEKPHGGRAKFRHSMDGYDAAAPYEHGTSPPFNKSSSTLGLCGSNSSVLPVQGTGGWEVYTSSEASVAECAGICTMSHVIRPAFTSSFSSSSGSSLAAVSRLPGARNSISIQNVAASVMRKASTLSSSFSSSLFTNSFPWQRRQERANSVASTASVDDIMFHSPPDVDERFGEYEYFTEMPHNSLRYGAYKTGSLKPPKHVATLTPNSRSNSVESQVSSNYSSALSLMMDHSGESAESSTSCPGSLFSSSYESVPIYSKNAVCLDVPAIDEDSECFETLAANEYWPKETPSLGVSAATTSPVAGYISKFHPDFVIQGCAPSRGLEDRILSAMQTDPSSSSSPTQTLILNSLQGELCILDSAGRTQPPNVTLEEVKKAEHYLETIFALEGNQAFEALKKCYESRFDI